MQTATPGPVSDYTGQDIYYRSIQHADGEKHDRLTIHDYLWRWDTDWFWCSRAFGAQNPTIRRFWPRRYRRSSFYWKLIGYDQRFDIADRIEKRNGRPPLERVVQDIEVPIGRTAEFVDWFLTNVPIEPIWLCPLRLARRRGLAAVPDRRAPHLRQHRVLVVGARAGPKKATPTRMIERRSANSTVTSRCTPTRTTHSTSSTSSTAEKPTKRSRRATTPIHVCLICMRRRCRDANERLREEEKMMTTYKDHSATCRGNGRRSADPCRDSRDLRRRRRAATEVHRVRRQLAPGPDDAELGLDLLTPRGTTYLATAPGDLGLARAYVVRRPGAARRASG